jgi:hypothetical protein
MSDAIKHAIKESEKDMEIIKKGGFIYVSQPDTEKSFKEFEKEMRKKLDKK